ncbi:hypothetical protein N7470_008124 [Penicillium chermesinum]|nr:hypothetical protein N7470_008124 [Penicillium chermesinum]
MGSHAAPQYVPSETRLFKPLKVGNVTLEHRIAMAPLTRLRSDDNHVPLPLMEKYYADRGCVPGTLVISEATAIAHEEEGQRSNPGFVSEAQTEAWRKIISAVHANKSFFFQQIWGMGRASDPKHLAERGFPYRSSSNVPMKGIDVEPTALTEEEILQIIQSFVDTAKRVVAAGGDGVEIHSAMDIFLINFSQPASTSALTSFQGSEKSDSVELYSYIISEIKKMGLKLAYISLVEATGDPGAIVRGDKAINVGKTLDFILEAWENRSPVMVAVPAKAVEEHYKHWDVIVAFGRHFISNPDLVFRVKNGIPLAPYNRATFYLLKQWEGYNDYPFSPEFLAAHPEAVHPMTE